MTEPKLDVDHDNGRISMTWDVDDALEIGYALISKGINQHGHVVDRGFHDDGTSLVDVARIEMRVKWAAKAAKIVED
jgi:basic membrane lipoprotein Med (substrate-binding protein (PBP1-ABC) superfamily)